MIKGSFHTISDHFHFNINPTPCNSIVLLCDGDVRRIGRQSATKLVIWVCWYIFSLMEEMDLVISSSTSSSLFRVLGHCYILAYDVCIKLFWHKEVEGTLGERNPLHSNCNKNRWHQEALFLPLSLHECGTACVALGLVLAYLSIKIKLIRIKFESTCSNNEAARPKVLVQSGTTQVVLIADYRVSH